MTRVVLGLLVLVVVGCDKAPPPNKANLEIVLFFVHTDRILLDKSDAVELLELAELDVRDFLNKHGIDGDSPAWFYDSEKSIPDDWPPVGTSAEAVIEYVAEMFRSGIM